MAEGCELVVGVVLIGLGCFCVGIGVGALVEQRTGQKRDSAKCIPSNWEREVYVAECGSSDPDRQNQRPSK